jgi:hypothetical protein
MCLRVLQRQTIDRMEDHMNDSSRTDHGDADSLLSTKLGIPTLTKSQKPTEPDGSLLTKSQKPIEPDGSLLIKSK